MKTKAQQFEDYKANGGQLDFNDWESSFKHDPSLELSNEEIRDWVREYAGDKDCLPTEEEWNEITKPGHSEIQFNETFKKERRVIMTETILSLLADMPQEKITQLLEFGTPEELVDWCKTIYDNEFDVNVETLGVVGADEIAWQESMAIFARDDED